MAEKKNKSAKNKNDDMILQDFQSSSKRFRCDLCKLEFNDSKSLNNHLIGKKHSKKMDEIKLKAKSKILHSASESEDSDETNEFFCEICQKSCNGYASYVTHKKGIGHTRNLKKQKLKQQLDHMPEIIKRDKEDGNSDDDDDILPKTYAKCPVCDKEFGGPESFQMHLKSAAHLRKVKTAESLKTLKKDDEGNSDDDGVYKKCEVCNKNFSGPVPYQVHMESKVHKKNLERQRIAEKIQEFCTKTDEGYICNECKKPFTDPLALKDHLENNNHEKQKIKAALEEFCNSNPGIYLSSIYPKESKEDDEDKETETDGNTSDEYDLPYFLICKICQMSFTGPESAQAHVNSKKHITAKRDKMLRKTLKEKQKHDNDKKRDNDKKHDNDNDKDETNGGALKEVLSNSKPTSSSKRDRKDSIDEFEVI